MVSIPDGYEQIEEVAWTFCTVATERAAAEYPERPVRRYALWTAQTRVLTTPGECESLLEAYTGPSVVRDQELLPHHRTLTDLPDPWRVLVGEDKRVLLKPDEIAWVAVAGDAVDVYWSLASWISDDERYLLLRGATPGKATVVVHHLRLGTVEIELDVFAPGG